MHTFYRGSKILAFFSPFSFEECRYFPPTYQSMRNKNLRTRLKSAHFCSWSNTHFKVFIYLCDSYPFLSQAEQAIIATILKSWFKWNQIKLWLKTFSSHQRQRTRKGEPIIDRVCIFSTSRAAVLRDVSEAKGKFFSQRYWSKGKKICIWAVRKREDMVNDLWMVRREERGWLGGALSLFICTKVREQKKVAPKL